MNISANLLLSGKADATNRKGAHTPPLERNMDYMKKILVLEDEPSIRSFVVSKSSSRIRTRSSLCST